MKTSGRRLTLFAGLLAILGFTWAPAGDPGALRFRHGATLLTSGRVLIAGGSGESSPHATALLFEAPSTWLPAGSMAEGRYWHSQTRLADGRVLVAGGHPGPLASAEIYDPGTNTWSTVAPMTKARAQHTASLLADGRVLVVGGVPGGLIGLADVEIYDPDHNTWATGPSLAIGRYDHSAVTLDGGRVLIVGGHSGADQISTCELYNPKWNVWELSASLYHRRQLPTAALLPNGKVLVAGGLSYDPPIFTAELIDPEQGTTTPAAELITNRFNHGGSLLADGRVLISGGQPMSGGTLSSAEIYDPVADAWSSAGSMASPRFFHSVTALPDGRAVVAGGLFWPYPTSAETWGPTDTVPPVITAPRSVTVEQTSPNGAPAPFPATAVDDVDGPVVVKSDAPEIFPPGHTLVILSATDRSGNVAIATVDVQVVDTRPPVIRGAAANPASLWPAKNQMIPVTISVDASDVADAAPTSRIVSVQSNGGTPGDAIVVSPLTVALRAVKTSGWTPPRAYTVAVACMDAKGNTALTTVTVRVERP